MPSISSMKKAWFEAVRDKNIDRMEHLHGVGAKIEWRSDEASCRMTALHHACMDDWEEGAGWLIDRGARINAPLGTKESALSLAVMGGNRSIVRKLLLQPDLHMDLVSLEGYTALHRAVMSDAEDLVRWLLAAGADPLIKTDMGLDILELAEEEASDCVIDVLEPFLAQKNAKALSAATKTTKARPKSVRL